MFFFLTLDLWTALFLTFTVLPSERNRISYSSSEDSGLSCLLFIPSPKNGMRNDEPKTGNTRRREIVFFDDCFSIILNQKRE